MYARPRSKGFGLRPTPSKPIKRPAQARARFTVQAIYDALVRIWRRDGWAGVTTRSVALETGIAVGTLYEYFPDKYALLSGYVRYCLEALVEAMGRRPLSLEGLLRLVCDPRAEGLPPFDAQMLDLEHEIAEPKHHRRAYMELLAAWRLAIAAIAGPVDERLVESLFVAAWGGRRYLLLVQPPLAAEHWVEQMHLVCASALRVAHERAPGLSGDIVDCSPDAGTQVLPSDSV
jgi:AcrR family transcriptional regulator